MPSEADAAAERPLRIGIVGAGAAAEGIHLPALARVPGVRVAAIADPARDRLDHVSRIFGIPSSFADYRDMIPHVDAAIVGIPHHLHAAVTVGLLDAGIDVLVEKPMAVSTAECDAMIEAADRSGAVLAVGLLRRFAPTLRFTKEAIDAGMLGRIHSFDVSEGIVFKWPVKSAAMFHPRNGGVLADIGTHLVDLMLWWFGDCASLEYRDDAMGGVEADALLEVQMANGITGRIELSRSRDLRCTCVIRGERGTLEVGTKTDSTVTITPAGGAAALSGRATTILQRQPPTCLADLFTAEMMDFVRAVKGDRRPEVAGIDGRRAVDIMETCYRQRRPLVFPFEPLLYNDARAAKAS